MSVPPSDERPRGELDDTARGAGIDTDDAAATATGLRRGTIAIAARDEKYV